ncbi:MAG: hypothetical protein KQJ78_12390 [Deltaproteobacteria bacterium]|nr:hypothetical protein [Deltaproteobacteria bacterium]
MQPARGPARWAAVFFFLVLLAGAGCGHLLKIADADRPALFVTPPADQPAAARLAPAILAHNPHQTHNLVGRVTASRDEQGAEVIRVDPAHPAIYYGTFPFTTAKGAYRNLVYRVHFPGTPASLAPFLLGWGDNLGLLIILTLDQTGHPVLVTTLGTCGCYVSLTATDYLPPESLPAGWTGRPGEIYGETLPARLAFRGLDRPRLVVEVRPGEHRVMGLLVVEDAAARRPGYWAPRPTELLPLEALERLPLPDGHTVSMFHEDGALAGHVKGAWKPWETLLMWPFSLDLAVGWDKAYGDPRNPFYTSLQPWYRHASDLNDFPRFLKFWGWRL